MSDHLPESFSLASILAEQGMHHQAGLWVRWLAKDNPETNPITIKPETASHVAEQFSWVPLPSCSPPGCPFPRKSLALSAYVSPQTIHFQVLDKSPVSGLGRESPFLQQTDFGEWETDILLFPRNEYLSEIHCLHFFAFWPFRMKINEHW